MSYMLHCPNCRQTAIPPRAIGEEFFTCTNCQRKFDLTLVTAREDQPQLGTCDRDSKPHPKDSYPSTCINWRPEDQPRERMRNMLRASAGSWYSEAWPQNYPCPRCGDCPKPCPCSCHIREAREAQGETPQQSELSASEWLLSMGYPLEKEYPANVVSAVMEQYAIYKIGPKVGRVETGAHPSQDALPLGMDYWLNRFEEESQPLVFGKRFACEFAMWFAKQCQQFTFPETVDVRARSTPSLPAQDALPKEPTAEDYKAAIYTEFGEPARPKTSKVHNPAEAGDGLSLPEQFWFHDDRVCMQHSREECDECYEHIGRAEMYARELLSGSTPSPDPTQTEKSTTS